MFTLFSILKRAFNLNICSKGYEIIKHRASDVTPQISSIFKIFVPDTYAPPFPKVHENVSSQTFRSHTLQRKTSSTADIFQFTACRCMFFPPKRIQIIYPDVRLNVLVNEVVSSSCADIYPCGKNERSYCSWSTHKLLGQIKICLKETYGKGRISKYLSDNFLTQNGLKQGDTLEVHRFRSL
jgi:hypothetical protein